MEECTHEQFTCSESRHPWRGDVHLHLDAYYGSDEERYQQYDSDTVHAKRIHFLDVLFHEHSHAFGALESLAHQYEIFSKCAKFLL